MEENVKEVDKLKAEVHDRLKDLREKSNYICGHLNALAERHGMIFTVNDTELYNRHKITCIFNKGDRYTKYIIDVDKCELSRLCGLDDNILGEMNPPKFGYMDYQERARYFADLLDCSRKRSKSINPPRISDVIFNDPATIVFWTDGTKTVVKCQEGDTFDHEKGITMAFMKKCNGNTGSYCDLIKEWVPVKKKEEEPQHLDIDKTQLDITEE